MFVSTVRMCAVAKEELNRIPIPIGSGKMEGSRTCSSNYGRRGISAGIAFWESGKGGIKVRGEGGEGRKWSGLTSGR